MEPKSGEKSSYNFYRILRSIWQSRGITRPELAAIHKLDKTTVSQIVGQLTNDGLVRVSRMETSNTRPGRRAEILNIDENWGFVAGLEIRPDAVNSCAVDINGNVLATHHHAQLVEQSNMSEAFTGALDGLLADDRVADKPLIGVGVGATGIVSRPDQMIVRSLPLNISERYDFGSNIASKVPVPVLLDNDANCCAWGELVYDFDRAPRSFLFLLLEFRSGPSRSLYGGDIGLGLGFVMNGSVYYGEEGSAGEFRSLYWHPGFTNQVGIPDDESSGILNRPDVLQRFVEEVGKHVALFVNTLNLQKVYIGGDVETIDDLLIGTIKSAIASNWPYDELTECDVELATHAKDIVAVGAAAMVLEHIFAEPLLPEGVRECNQIWRTIYEHRTGSLSTFGKDAQYETAPGRSDLRQSGGSV